jgi:hypothetical protein
MYWGMFCWFMGQGRMRCAPTVTWDFMGDVCPLRIDRTFTVWGIVLLTTVKKCNSPSQGYNVTHTTLHAVPCRSLRMVAQFQNPTMDSLDQRLQELLAQACRYPAKTAERQKILTVFLSRVEASGKLWRGAGVPRDLYRLYLLNRIESYDRDRASVMTWINFHLKHKIMDLQAKKPLEKKTIAWFSDENDPNPWESLPDLSSNPWNALVEDKTPPPEQMIPRILAWLERDRNLRRVHMLDRPEVNGALLIAKRLPPPVPWEQLGQELKAKPAGLTNFYYKRCLPELRAFLISQGYGRD